MKGKNKVNKNKLFCPFCGSRDIDSINEKEVYWGQCNSCHARGPAVYREPTHLTKDQAIDGSIYPFSTDKINMTINDAIARIMANGEEQLWARPLSWRGTRAAICLDGNKTLLVVPSKRGGFTWVPRTSEIIGPWEVLSPSEFYKLEESEK